MQFKNYILIFSRRIFEIYEMIKNRFLFYKDSFAFYCEKKKLHSRYLTSNIITRYKPCQKKEKLELNRRNQNSNIKNKIP